MRRRHEGQLRQSCRHRTQRYSNNRVESDYRMLETPARHAGSANYGQCMYGDCRNRGGTDDSKRKVLGVTKADLHGQDWVFDVLPGRPLTNRQKTSPEEDCLHQRCYNTS